MKGRVALYVLASTLMVGAHGLAMGQEWDSSTDGLHIYNTNSGNVGIGTDAPTTKLQIVGGGDAVLNGGGYVVLGTTSSSSLALDDNEIMARYNGGSSPLYLQSDGGSIYFHSNLGNTSVAVFKPNGDVGIGTSSPQSKLAVNGTITAREVTLTSSGWPDFVFEAQYRLMPLNELEEQIRAEGHLPDIPSAEEVEEKGANVGEMQVKLLQKVEELTLYTIAQEKEIQALRKQNREMEARLEALERAISARR